VSVRCLRYRAIIAFAPQGQQRRIVLGLFSSAFQPAPGPQRQLPRHRSKMTPRLRIAAMPTGIRPS
jgi:hypothetical protein